MSLINLINLYLNSFFLLIMSYFPYVSVHIYISSTCITNMDLSDQNQDPVDQIVLDSCMLFFLQIILFFLFLCVCILHTHI